MCANHSLKPLVNLTLPIPARMEWTSKQYHQSYEVVLQLIAPRYLFDALFISFLWLASIHLFRRLPAKGLQPLRKNGMRVVVACVHPVRVHSAQVLDLQLDERACQLGGVAQSPGKAIGLELEPPRERVHAELHERIHRRQCIREEDESHDDGMLLDEAKGRVERVVVDEDGEEEEDVEEVGLRFVSKAASR